MPIEIYTGKPGNGKTALMMERLVAEATKKDPRPLFAYGIDGLEPGLATVLKDPREWNAVKPGEVCTCHDTDDAGPCTAHVIPNGAMIFIDEAWKWFGHLHDASRQATPAHVLALAEHRHRGIDMVWTAQGPNQIYPFARPLIADHYHTVRRFGTQLIDVFKWEELQEEVKSTARRELAIRQTRALPKSVFGRYKSAEQHTIKRKLPWRLVLLPLLPIAIAGCAWWAYVTLRPSAAPAPAQEAGAAGLPAAPPTAAPQSAATPQSRAATPAEYVETHTPRFATMPWSAPIFDGRAAVSDPLLMCMSSTGGLDAQGEWKEPSCGCRTEQGTMYDIAIEECLLVAKRGMPYNPYRERVQPERAAQPEPVARAEGDAERRVLIGVGGRVGDIASYGDFGYETGRYVGQGVGR
ncbi:zonular occludens toxin domain-containing protein [Luteimonas sp BLCC-B24]|uniref:zonular occludens toxin domain-containing protein n=1 Tax=Luteimonas sp. BLCC-B24 TaxID=3025317 RepID=UPI00234CC144|nr:zonular occludens toxin domain-containing protein [Luteimonas sp. BLCC-B24]MDC7805227.1 zonular occludens toxin domain-containing protein [Luteimonas sp. BLCC-B24]